MDMTPAPPRGSARVKGGLSPVCVSSGIGDGQSLERGHPGRAGPRVGRIGQAALMVTETGNQGLEEHTALLLPTSPTTVFNIRDDILVQKEL